MPRKKAPRTEPEKPVPSPEVAPEAPAAAPEPAPAPAKPMKKSQAMDAALKAGAVMPNDGVAYVLEHFGLEVSNKQFSTHKNLVKSMAEIDARNRMAKPAKKHAPPPTTAVAKTPPPPAPVEPPAPTHAKVTASPADLARQLKALVADHGAVAVGEMLDVFRE